MNHNSKENLIKKIKKLKPELDMQFEKDGRYDASELFRYNLIKKMLRDKITVQELADRLGVSHPGVSKVINKQETPSLYRAQCFAEAVDATIPKLLRKP